MKETFENTSLAFKDRSNRELRKAYWLFRLVGNPFLVKIGSVKLRVALWLRFPVNWILKPTIFSHFCGGERISECDETIEKLAASGIQTILDYSAEGKETDAEFDRTAHEVMETIKKAVTDKNIPYAVFKPTGMARFGLLEKLQSGQKLSAAEQGELERVHGRIGAICRLAEETGVPVMVDAEESWIQEGVDRIVEELTMKYNKDRPLVFNTLQLYRTDRLDYLERFSARARESGVVAAFKLVRGAYLEKERDRAAAMGYSSPVYADKPATDEAFDKATRFCLEHIDHMAVCIGTHNEKSCALAADAMDGLGIPHDHPRISFAQLLGMSDHISYPLAAGGFNVCKYVPYGPVRTVVPYLIRRAEENTSVAGQTSRELFLIKKEILRRKAAGKKS
jgi:proline dehydrogenase